MKNKLISFPLCASLIASIHISAMIPMKKNLSPIQNASKSLKPYLTKLINKEDLCGSETEKIWDLILEGEVSNEQIAGLLCLLKAKGETPQELSGCVKAMKKSALKINIEKPLLDIVGTGGDGANTVNISTMSAVVCSAAGARVGKCGNRSSSSMCGSADVLEGLGLNVTMEPKMAKECFERTGITFMFAPTYFPAMKNVGPVRKSLGIRSTFNIIGPLCNPAYSDRVVIGVYEENLLPLIAQTLIENGEIESGMVIHGCGLDEISPIGPSKVLHVYNIGAKGEKRSYGVKEFVLEPLDFGIARCKVEDLVGGNREENVKSFTEILMEGPNESAKRDSVILNAGVGLYVYGLSSTLKEAFELARNTIESGKALKKLEEWIKISQNL